MNKKLKPAFEKVVIVRDNGKPVVIVAVELKPERVQRKRTKGWRMPENTVYVGRGSRWGNPFKVGNEFVRQKMTAGGGQIANTVVDNAHAVRLYKRFTANEVRIQVEAYQELRGKNLACWCKEGEPCHADILLEIANR